MTGEAGKGWHGGRKLSISPEEYGKRYDAIFKKKKCPYLIGNGRCLLMAEEIY